MPFTSVMGAQSIIKPGVATSGTRPASPFNGQVLYETDTAKIVSWNGSAWVYGAAGKVLQVVTGIRDVAATNNTSTLADTNLTATITPSSTSSKILVVVSHSACRKSNANAENRLYLVLQRNGVNIWVINDSAGYTGTAIYSYFSVGGSFLDSPASVAALTYKTQFMNPQNTADVIVQLSNNPSTIILMEISA